MVWLHIYEELVKIVETCPYYVLLKIRLWSRCVRVEAIFSFLIRYVVIIFSFS